MKIDAKTDFINYLNFAIEKLYKQGVGIKYEKITDNNTYEEIWEMFNDVKDKLDRKDKRVLQQKFSAYIQSMNNTTKDKKEDDDVELDNFIERLTKEYQQNNDINAPLQFFNKDNVLVNKEKLEEKRKYTISKNNNKKKRSKKLRDILIVLLAAGTLLVAKEVCYNNNRQVIDEIDNPNTISDELEQNEYKIIHYTIQSGDFSKEIVAEKLGINSSDFDIDYDFSKAMEGDKVELKVYDIDFANEWIYENEPALLQPSFTYEIVSGENSIESVAEDMMSAYPILKDYYNGKTGGLINDLIAQNKSVESIGRFQAGTVRLQINASQKLLDSYGYDNLGKIR